MRARHIFSGALLVGLLAGGCGGSSDGGGGGGSSVAIDDLPPVLAGAYCDAAKACFGPLLDIFLPGESCTANYETAISDELPRIKQAIEKGTIVYDGSKVQACVAAVKARGCSTTNVAPPECTAAFDGTVEVGGDCDMDGECKGDDTYCKVGAACPGKCSLREQAGGDCASDDHCGANLKCSEDTSKCIVPAKNGEACGGGSAPECEPGQFCLGEDSDANKPGTCKSLEESFVGKEGDACYFDGAPLCTADLRCYVEGVDTTAGKLITKCGPPLTSGAACKIGIPDGCPADEFCKAAPQALDGTCTKKPAAGQPCEKQFENDVCAPNTRCDAGTCKPLQKLGGSCTVDDVCYSGNCVNGGCAPSGACQ